MRPYFAGHPLIGVLFAGSVVVWIAFELRQALKRRPEASSADRGTLMSLRVSIATGLVAAGLAAARASGASLPGGVLLFAVGLVLLWGGIALRLWSFITLGRYFTFNVMTSASQPVITTGPYRFVRHPSYLGIMLALIGIGATYGNWLSLGALVLFPLIGFVYRIHVEEAALSTTLGSAYTTYASGRKRLIPFVW
jgi:protein-S-isoprenylcysteine O-methyltransferase Ste14